MTRLCSARSRNCWCNRFRSDREIFLIHNLGNWRPYILGVVAMYEGNVIHNTVRSNKIFA